MKKATVLFLLTIIVQAVFAQSNEVKRLVNEGVAFHDRGDYTHAISKYDEALKIEADNLLALTEKAYSLLAMGNPEESIVVCKQAVNKHKGSDGLKTLYVTYGNAFDLLKQPKKSLSVYSDGLKQFPDFYLLHFNKAITLAGQNKFDDALLSLQSSTRANPAHASSHHAIARIAEGTGLKIPAMLAYTRFIILEQKGQRAKENATNLVRLAGSGAKQTGDKAVTITLDPTTLKQAGLNSKRENDFSSAELLLSMSAAMDYDEKFEKQTEAQRFARKMESLFSMLGETAKNHKGFYWEYYVPYCVDLKEKKFIDTFSNIVLAATGDNTAQEWLTSNSDKVKEFAAWSMIVGGE